MRKFSCNKSVYKTWLQRYWPGAALMAVVFLLAAVSYGSSLSRTLAQPGYADAMTAEQLASFICGSSMPVMLSIFVGGAAGVAALLCFSYLQQPASATLLHSLPLRREGLFATATAAGFTLLGAPILLSGILFGLGMLMHGVLSLPAVLLYMLVMLLCALLLFSITALLSMLTGHTAAAAVFTIVALFGPVILENVYLSYCARYLFGFSISGESSILRHLNPLYWMNRWMDDISHTLYAGERVPLWPALVFLLLSALFLAGAVLIYRRRQVERAGDVVAVKPMRPVFRFGLALLGAGLLGTVCRGFFGANFSFASELAFGVIGGALGYFAAEMLLTRSLRVLRRWKGALVFCLVYVLLMAGLYTDVLGYGSRQLDAGQVEYIVVGGTSNRVNVAMRGGRLMRYDMTQDLDLRDAETYLSNVSQNMGGEIPDGLALQILQQDHTVLKGEDIAAAVTLQNMLGARSKELMNLRQAHDMGGYFLSNASARYHYIPVMAKMKDGSVFFRHYTLVVPEGEQADLLEAWADVAKQEAVGQAENILRASQEVSQIHLGFNGSVYNGPRTSWTLNAGEWDGLFEAYLADVQAQPATVPLGNSYTSAALINCTLAFGEYQSEDIQLLPSHTGSMRWLIQQGLLTEEELAEAEKLAEEVLESERNLESHMYVY